MKLPDRESPRIIISGGGTGGHLYPALAIAQAIKRKCPNAEILFVGAMGKLEMEKVPEHGFKIIGLNIRGFQRSFSWDNLKFPFRLLGSYLKSWSVLKTFKPTVVVGVGGYASGPLLLAAEKMNIPTLIQEQNSYPGKTNLFLAKKAQKICVAYPGMDQFFPAEKLVLTGNPIRKGLLVSSISIEEAYHFFGLDPQKLTVLILGGSGGARSINEGILSELKLLFEKNIQIIWQTGKNYFQNIKSEVDKFLKGKDSTSWFICPFLDQIQNAYQVSDLVISRAGAGTISELTLLGKPCILVPSPNVAEDHQTKNARVLIENKAAEMIQDADAKKLLVLKALQLLDNPDQRKSLSANMMKLGFPEADEKIGEMVLDLASQNLFRL